MYPIPAPIMDRFESSLSLNDQPPAEVPPTTSDSIPVDPGPEFSATGKKIKSKNKPEDVCLVCNVATRGIHFQVPACRACAAFFRRSEQSPKAYRCRRNGKDCDLTKLPNGKPICRYCRLQKCYSVGMKKETTAGSIPPAVVDCASSTKKVDVTASSNSPIPQPRVTDGNRFERNVDSVIEEIKTLFKSGHEETTFHTPVGVHSTPFQQLQYAFARFRENMCPPGPLPTADAYNKMQVYPFREEYAKRAAKMMMACSAFSGLEADDKWSLFRYAWPLIWNIERQFSSCQLFGYDPDDHRQLLTRDVVIDLKTTGIYMEGMPDEKLRELMKFWLPVQQTKVNILQVPIQQMQLTQFEVCYVIGLIIFNVNEIRGLSDKTTMIGEQLVDQFSNELHNYYTYEVKMNNYAARHAKLIRLISQAQQFKVDVKDHMALAKIFDIFVTNIYDSELFA